MFALILSIMVGLSWQANKESDLAGYRVYKSCQSGNYISSIADVGLDTFLLNIPVDCDTTYFVVTAYDTAGNESAFSNEVYKLLISQIHWLGDLNDDCIIDGLDQIILSVNKGKVNNISDYDLNHDGIIDGLDQIILSSNKGKVCLN